MPIDETEAARLTARARSHREHAKKRNALADELDVVAGDLTKAARMAGDKTADEFDKALARAAKRGFKGVDAARIAARALVEVASASIVAVAMKRARTVRMEAARSEGSALALEGVARGTQGGSDALEGLDPGTAALLAAAAQSGALPPEAASAVLGSGGGSEGEGDEGEPEPPGEPGGGSGGGSGGDNGMPEATPVQPAKGPEV